MKQYTLEHRNASLYTESSAAWKQSILYVPVQYVINGASLGTSLRVSSSASQLSLHIHVSTEQVRFSLAKRKKTKRGF